jgi:predicted P-loop ATPase
MSSLVPFPPPNADEHARAETERKQRAFDWADRVLEELGLAHGVRQASTIEELRLITFDGDAVEVTLAIRDALHPASGQRAAHFKGLNDRALKRLLKKRFAELKKQHEQELRCGQSTGQSGQSAAHDWTDDLQLDDEGGVLPLLANLILFLRHHPAWQGVLGYDEFSAHVVIRKPPPWDAEAPDTPWTDHDETHTRIWFQNQRIKPGLGDVGRAVQAAARSNAFHPVRDYFNGLVWDGMRRLDRWLIKFFHADETPYIRAIGPRILIAAVARIYQPGCKVDHVPIFEGPQGKQKSEALRTIAIRDVWFTDRLSHIASKDAALETVGMLLVEIAEMDALTRASSSTIKSFITRRFDPLRPPYGKHRIRLLRQCIFAGTINPPVGGYLTDPTGARRFWPIACHGWIDRDGLECDLAQLWAEAVHHYSHGATWWLETPELEALATAEQQARFKVDPWQPRIARWLGRRKRVRLSEVLCGALRIAEADQTRSVQMRVASILTNLRFTKHRPRRGRDREYCYERDES